MKILVDMNLSPTWISFFERQGWEAMHWSSVGDPGAPDGEILTWAKEHDYIIFTHDLDFGIVLASTQARGPSVIQARTQDVLPVSLGEMMMI